MGLISRVSSRTYRLKKKPNKNKMAEENWAEEVAVEQHEDMAVEEEINEPKMFGKWDLSEVKCQDMALSDYINFDKPNATSSNDWSTLSCKKAETTVKKCFLCESSNTLLKSFTSWPAKTQSRFVFPPS